MKAWQVRAWGEPEEMTLADIPVPEPGAGEIRIANRAAAVNFFDILQIQGKYQVKPPFPFTPGAEVSGVVDALGEGVAGFGADGRGIRGVDDCAGGSRPPHSRWDGLS
jgi:NADPH2:quinone reductase